jgi:Clp amino terminal domain, pathogenicity island component
MGLSCPVLAQDEADEAIIGHGERAVRGEMALNPRTKEQFAFAPDEARRLNHRLIGTEHLLLGLIRESGGGTAR